MSLRWIVIMLLFCATLAGVVVWADSALGWSDWLRLTLVAFATSFLVNYVNNRKRQHG